MDALKVLFQHVQQVILPTQAVVWALMVTVSSTNGLKWNILQRMKHYMPKNAESNLCKKRQVNIYCLRKCIHILFFLIQHRFALTNNYEDLIDIASNKLHEPIINRCLDSCPKYAKYKSNTIKDAQFLAIYANEAENSSHRETFAIF